MISKPNRGMELGARLITILIMVLIVALFVAMISTGEVKSRFKQMMRFKERSTGRSYDAGHEIDDLVTHAWEGQEGIILMQCPDHLIGQCENCVKTDDGVECAEAPQGANP